MDPVRFGRALGVGTRLAAKTAITAVDAALAPNPNPPANSAASANSGDASTSARRPEPSPEAATPAHRPTQNSRAAAAASRANQGTQNVRNLAQALSSPVRRLSGVLWLELTGTFFGLFALTASVGAWRLRTAWRPSPSISSDHAHLLMTIAVALLFGYFCISSFLRARRRSRRR